MSIPLPTDPPIPDRLATEASLAASGRAGEEVLRPVELRGISAPVSIATVPWS